MVLDFFIRLLGTNEASFLYRLFGASDSSIVGWLNTCLYFVLAWRCFLNIKGEHIEYEQLGVWLGFLMLFLLLGLNKQLDFHVYLIYIVKSTVIKVGLWQYKQALKFILLGVGILMFLSFIWFIRHAVVKLYQQNKTFWRGGLALLLYVFLRYATFNNFITGYAHFLVEYFSSIFELLALSILLIGTFAKQSVGKEIA